MYSKTGYFFSQKNNKELRYRSLLEQDAYKKLEKDTNVLEYHPEPFCIPYTEYIPRKNIKITKCYTPDILIIYTDGKRELVEVKPDRLVNSDDNTKKIETLKKYSKAHGISCDVWGDKKLGIK